MEKKFIRFICYTKNHPLGKKIHALGTITKIYDDNGNFLKMKSGYVYARENEIEIDIDLIQNDKQIDYHVYLPLHHFKVDKGNIVKKSDTEIQTIEAERTVSKEQKRIEQEQKEQETQNNKDIINDDNKSDKEKLNALIKLYKGD